jgi:hypothetical protein
VNNQSGGWIFPDGFLEAVIPTMKGESLRAGITANVRLFPEKR